MGRPATLRIDILADASGVGRGVADADSKLGRLGGAAKGAGLAIGAGLAVGALAVGAFAVSSVKAASDVEQSFGAVESVFGKAAGQVKAYAETAATNVGLAKSEYAGLAAVVGSQLQSMGVEQTASAAKTDELIKMGADLAATFGGSVSDAVGAVGSLLRGERDPIERYGVAIKAADVEARLAADGQDKLTGAARKTAEAQATLKLLTEATSNAHGAFGRESNTLAGQQERLRAQFENVKATVGAGLTPVLTALLGFVTSTVLPGMTTLAGQLRDKLGPAFTAIGTFVTGTVLPAFRSLTGDVNGPTKGALSGLATLAQGPVVAAARALANYFTGNVVPALRAVATFVTNVVVPALTAIATFVLTRVVPAITTLAGGVLSGLRSMFQSVTTAVNNNREQLASLGNAAQSVGRVLTPLASVVGTVLGGAFRVLGGAISAVIGILGAVVGAAQAAGRAIDSIVGAARAAADVIGKLNPFGGDVPLFGAGVPLVGGYGPSGYGPGGLATAALGDQLAGLQLLAASTAGAGTRGAVTVDARTFVTIDGALDAPAVARQLEKLLRDQAARLGRTTAAFA